jgi:hypothetical protein
MRSQKINVMIVKEWPYDILEVAWELICMWGRKRKERK